MKDYLERFSKRMEFVAVVDSIVGRVNKNQEIERQFSDGELDNILMSVLVFIMETTLTEEQDCTIGAITDFLADILPVYGKQMSLAELEDLSRYLVKDLLQNKGEARAFPVMDYFGGRMEFPVWLITDKLDANNQILYELTKQGFDFLFRTKEVDDELGFEIEAVRLRMLINKKNYKKAMSQSRYILAMLKEKRNELRQFEQQLRYDIFSVSAERYDAVTSDMHIMLSEEKEIMQDIERMLDQARKHLVEESRSFVSPDEKSLAARREIFFISENVQRALAMQRELLIKCDNLRRLYDSLLLDSLLFHQIGRFDLEEHILERLENAAFADAADLNELCDDLLAPLFLPDLKRSLNLNLMYERQAKSKDIESGGIIGEDETLDDAGRLERVRLRNDAHILVIELLLEYAKTRATFLFSDFWEYIKRHRHIEKMTAERLVFLDMLKLYEIREIDLVKWREESIGPLDCVGEFDLDYCLTYCFEKDKTLFEIERMIIDRTGEFFSCQADPENSEGRVVLDNLRFEVSLNETNGKNTNQAFI